MSIRSSIIRSKDDNKPFSTKSYSNLEINYELISAKEFVKNTKEDLPKRLYDREYSIDHVETLIRIFNKNKEIITVNQLRDIFDDVGFNTDVTFSEVHGADIMMVYNIGGFVVPFWKVLASVFYKRKPELEHLYLTKLSPGKKRLHCRLSEYSDGSWYMTSHIDDANWLNFLNPVQAFKSHIEKGTGNYEVGTQLMVITMDKVLEAFKKQSSLFVDVDDIWKNLKK